MWLFWLFPRQKNYRDSRFPISPDFVTKTDWIRSLSWTPRRVLKRIATHSPLCSTLLSNKSKNSENSGN